MIPHWTACCAPCIHRSRHWWAGGRSPCSVHPNRTLLRRLGSIAHKPAYKPLKHTMYCLTGIQNRQLYEQAIAAIPDSYKEMKKHINSFWLQIAPKWAMYARQHSPMLLQVTTNPCESWHRKLKAGAGLSKGQVSSHGIFGMILNIIDTARDVKKIGLRQPRQLSED